MTVKPETKTFPLVLVTWRDAYGPTEMGEIPSDPEDEQDCIVRTVGHLVMKGRKFVHLSHELVDRCDGTVARDTTQIPHGIILSIQELLPKEQDPA